MHASWLISNYDKYRVLRKISPYTEPSGYPSNVEVINQTTETIIIQWSRLKCRQRNGPITGYSYQVYRDFVDISKGICQRNMITLSLLGASCMHISVAAMNEAGIGEYSPPLTIQVAHSELGKWHIQNKTWDMSVNECIFVFEQSWQWNVTTIQYWMKV